MEAFAVIATHENSRLPAYGAFRHGQRWGDLPRQGVGNAVGAEVSPAVDRGPEPSRELIANFGLEPGLVLHCHAENRRRHEMLLVGSIRGRHEARDAEVVDRAVTFTVENQHGLLNRWTVRGEVQAGDALHGSRQRPTQELSGGRPLHRYHNGPSLEGLPRVELHGPCLDTHHLGTKPNAFRRQSRSELAGYGLHPLRG